MVFVVFVIFVFQSIDSEATIDQPKAQSAFNHPTPGLRCDVLFDEIRVDPRNPRPNCDGCDGSVRSVPLW